MNDRELIVKALSCYKPGKTKTEALLNDLLGKCSDKPFVNNFCCGIIRSLPAIDIVIAKLSGAREKKTSPQLWAVLRCGVFDIIYRPRQEIYAAVNEWVKLAGGKKQRGFANAVLRTVIRAIECRSGESPLSSNFLPVSGSLGCIFKQDIFSSPENAPSEYLSQVYSLLEWLVSGWIKKFGLEKTLSVCRASNRKPGLYLRPNKTLTTPEKLLEMLREDGAAAKRIGDIIALEKAGRPVEKLPGYNEGLFCVQDITAFEAGLFVNPSPGQTILDLCSAPGTKSSHLAELMQGAGEVIATDINPARLEKARENKQRLRLENITILEYEKAFEYAANRQIDAVLLDVPCSNSGVLSKRLDMRYRLTPEGIDKLNSQQYDIIKTVLRRLPAVKKLFYSTCSVEKSENYEILHKLLCELDRGEIRRAKLTLPSDVSFGRDGGYIAEFTL
ncbi:Ribosomal RNA small subunit methyltransferase B [Sedimentisphaera cyanobacteriorum]|uniref:Ribosomal RNA small subunit methyltransferase B n=1 Tax=Sedimentisphaera cyanobacteriorum TaxID=1940790 RepID=A0A1Q2HT30_9BACT|nr:transcription antitermination factor NusB [Sedimentisphaera cyanobacteriorum]AQQ10506.1 Ribosomal RNA small subunit methyltransferase B [Sedimentisphaera cyanobacteriorum]